MAAVESKSRCAVGYAVDRLEEEQLIKRIPGRARNIWPVQACNFIGDIALPSSISSGSIM